MPKTTKTDRAISDPLGAVHLLFGHLRRWLLGPHHGGQSCRHLQHYLDEFVFRFSHRFAKLIDLGLATPLTPYWQFVGRTVPNLKLAET